MDNILEEKLLLFAQKVNDAYPWGTGHTDILLKVPSPSDLDSDDTLDYHEVTDMDDAVEALQISKIFVLADISDFSGDTILPFKAVAQIGIAAVSGTTPHSYCTKVVFNLGTIDTLGAFTSKATVTATPNVNTDSTTYQFLSASAFFSKSSTFVVEQAKKLALQIKVYGKVLSETTGPIASIEDYSGTVAGTVKMNDVGHGRATADEIVITATTNYNGAYTLTKINNDSFYVTAAFVADETATWTLVDAVCKIKLMVSRGSGDTYLRIYKEG